MLIEVSSWTVYLMFPESLMLSSRVGARHLHDRIGSKVMGLKYLSFVLSHQWSSSAGYTQQMDISVMPLCEGKYGDIAKCFRSLAAIRNIPRYIPAPIQLGEWRHVTDSGLTH